MRILLDFRVPCVTEANGLRQRINLVFFSGKEMPAFSGACAAIALEISLFSCGGVLRLVARVDAHCYDIKFTANIELANSKHCAGKSVQYLRAQHGALVIHQHQNDRLLAKVLLQLDCLAVFIVESQIERDLLVQALIKPNLVKN